MRNYNHNILITGILSNVEKNFNRNFNQLKLIFSQVFNVRYLFIESDSTDNTLNLLAKCESEIKDFRYISLGKLNEQYPEKLIRKAFCRNRYLQEIHENKIYANLDFLVVADVNGITEDIVRRSVTSCFEYKNWDAMFANQDGYYFDLRSLRYLYWCNEDIYQIKAEISKYLSNQVEIEYISWASKLVKIKKNSPLMEVDSAFGGLGIYKLPIAKSAKYNAVNEQNYLTSEHVAFNKELKKYGAKLYINPLLITKIFAKKNILLKLFSYIEFLIGLTYLYSATKRRYFFK